MPECETCGGDQFEVIDGQYYCEICQTQSQHLREEELDIDEGDATNFSHSLIVKIPKVKENKGTEKALNYGRPWQTHEGWTVIIKHQVEALIKLGADPRLKDVVLRLWILYLSKCGIAFNKDEALPHHLSVMRHRDKVVPSVSEPTTGEHTKKMKNIRKKMMAMTTVKQEKAKKEKQKLMESLQGEQFYEGDNPFEDNEMSEDDSDDSGCSRYSSDENFDQDSKEDPTGSQYEGRKLFNSIGKTGSREKVRLQSNPEYMTGNRTLAFSYIGMLYLHDLFAPIDFIRLIDSGKVPYKQNIVALLPSDMKFCTNDAESFRMNYQDKVPSVSTLRYEAAILLCYLNILGTKPVSFEMVCSRYIEELKLPGEFHHLIRVHIKRVPYPLRITRLNAKGLPRSLQEYELLAIGIIVMLLKLLFVLNDVTEVKISDYAMKLRKYFKLESDVFVLKEWLDYMTYVIQDTKKNFLPKTIYDIPKLSNIDPIVKEFVANQEAMSEVLDQRISKNRTNQNSVTRKTDFKDTIDRQLSTLKEKYQYRRERSQFVDPDPESSQHKHIPGMKPPPMCLKSILETSAAETERAKEMQKHQAKENGNKCKKPNLHNISDSYFKKCTLQYVLDINFLKQYTESSKLRAENFNPAILRPDADINDLNTDLGSFTQSDFTTSTQIEEKLGHSYEEKEGVKLNDFQETEEINANICNDLEKEAEELISKREYWYTPLREMNKKPMFYERILQICHVIIGCDINDIHRFVRRVEYMFLDREELKDFKEKGFRTTYMKNHFEIPDDVKHP